MALWIGDDHLEFHGASAVAEGWFGRASRLLSSVSPAAEHGWLIVFEAHSLLSAGDALSAMSRAAESRDLGRQCGAVDLEMFSLATEGLAMVDAGEVERGLRCLDEATAGGAGRGVRESRSRGLDLLPRPVGVRAGPRF